MTQILKIFIYHVFLAFINGNNFLLSTPSYNTFNFTHTKPKSQLCSNSCHLECVRGQTLTVHLKKPDKLNTWSSTLLHKKSSSVPNHCETLWCSALKRCQSSVSMHQATKANRGMPTSALHVGTAW